MGIARGIGIPKPEVFYGWWIVAAGATLGAMHGGLYYYSFGAFFVPLNAEFGWSRAQVGAAFSLGQLAQGILFPIAGLLIHRLGPRRAITIGVALAGIGYMLLTTSHSLFAFYLMFMLVATGCAIGTTPLASMTAITNWFVRRRSTASGWMMAGYGLGGGIGTFFLGWLVSNYDWRMAAALVGAIFWLVGIPVAQMVRRRPEEMGYLPDGDVSSPPAIPVSRPPGSSLSVARRAARPEAPDLTLRQAVRGRAFWLIAVSVALRNLVGAAVAVHQLPFLIDRGYSMEVAAGIAGGTLLTGVPGRVFFGWLGDRWERRWVLATCHALMGIGVLLVTAAPPGNTLWLGVSLLLIYAPAYGGGWPIANAIITDYTGRRHYPTIFGLCSGLAVIGSVLGPVTAGYLFDASHSYTLALQMFAALLILGLPLFWLLRRPAQ
ncbi:MAG TPA: MFS transporter [Chloroflexota bacterium]|nr:MFS transporter [Chloroflexota bacterium]